jgi:hypothetical protein
MPTPYSQQEYQKGGSSAPPSSLGPVAWILTRLGTWVTTNHRCLDLRRVYTHSPAAPVLRATPPLEKPAPGNSGQVMGRSDVVSPTDSSSTMKGR